MKAWYNETGQDYVSLFECILDLTQFRRLKYELEELIDEREVSLHFYNLGDS